MWLYLLFLVPFEYFRIRHLLVFICQDYLLLTLQILLFLLQLPHYNCCWHNKQDSQVRLLSLLDWQSSGDKLHYTLSVLPPKLTWLEPTFTTILSARKYTMINLYNIAFIRPSHKCNVPSYTCIQDDFIPLLVYPNDEKPTDYFK